MMWNTTMYGGVESIRIHPKLMWTPDLLMYNRLLSGYGFDGFDPNHTIKSVIFATSADEKFDGTYQTNVVVSHDGSCLYVPPGLFKSTCKIDITWFPFDDQQCDLKFGSWTYSGWQVVDNIIKQVHVGSVKLKAI